MYPIPISISHITLQTFYNVKSMAEIFGDIYMGGKYCKSGYIRNVFIFAIFRESIALQIYESAKSLFCNIQTYTKPFIINS